MLGEQDYVDSFAWMKAFTDSRDTSTRDEFWVLNHPPVYTQGTSCKAIPRQLDLTIPLVKSDRGGQITYHGPGQLIIYLLIDIKRLGLGPKRLVSCIESAIIALLNAYDIKGSVQNGAPGVYVEGRKIAALGLRIKQGATYHGLSLNIDMDLSPYDAIDPCGYEGLQITQLSDLGVNVSNEQISNQLIDFLIDSIYSKISGA